VPIAGFIVDLYCLEQQLVVESDGGQHLDPNAIRYDSERTEKLRDLGIRVLRFADDVVLRDTDVVMSEIYSVLMQNPHPNPLPEYRERE
jgi:ATP-dependent helicase HrpA/adenine-specific DNA-methyltransferase